MLWLGRQVKIKGITQIYVRKWVLGKFNLVLTLPALTIVEMSLPRRAVSSLRLHGEMNGINIFMITIHHCGGAAGSCPTCTKRFIITRYMPSNTYTGQHNSALFFFNRVFWTPPVFQ